jgi:hypothetical protein
MPLSGAGGHAQRIEVLMGPARQSDLRRAPQQAQSVRIA